MTAVHAAVGIPAPAVPFQSPVAGYLTLVDVSAATTITASATPHTVGAWTELIAASTTETDWLSLSISNGTQAGGVDTRALLDIGVGAAASEVVIVASIPVGFLAANTNFVFPVNVPEGSRVSARLQALITVETVGIVCYLSSSTTARRSPSKLVTLNADTAASTSSQFMTASNTWTEIAASTAQPFQGLLAVPCGGASAVWSNDPTEVMSLGVGAAGAETLLARTPLQNWSSGNESITGNSGASNLTACSARLIPAGSRVVTKITTGRAYKGVIVFGVPYK